jgi:DNA-binding NarL/FixJ family response regulator
MRNSLISLIASLPTVDLVAECRDLASLSRIGPQIQPDLLVVTAGHPAANLTQMIAYKRSAWPAGKSLVLAENVQQKREAEQAGADMVVLEGTRAAELVELINCLLAGDRLNSATIALS